ncbi:hypothetical protein BaRGS_00021040, partial [Batillaria attramentaria]
FDDSSSISSGDISDTIAEISTDENLTGSSQGALSDTNVYNSLKRNPRDLTQGFLPHGHPHLQQGSKRAPSLGTSAFMGTDYHSDSGIGTGPNAWRKYSLPQTNKLLSSDPSDYAYPYASNSFGGWTSRSDQDYASFRKLSTASHPEFSPRGDSGYGDSERTFSQSERGTHSPSPGTKRDCETNTDQSHLLETSMRRTQNSRNSGGGGGGNANQSSNGTPSSGGSGSMFGYRRPLSNTSTSSAGSGKSSKGSSVVGSRLAKHGMEAVGQMVRSGSDSVAHNTPTGIPRPSSAASTGTARSCHSDMGPESYCSSTLERKRKGLTPSKSTGAAQTDRDFQSNSLGRRRLFGSKGSLSNKPGENGALCHSTIISNPHATYGKLGEGNGAMGKNLSHYVNLIWQRGANGHHVPAPAPPGQEGESMDTMVVQATTSIQHQIQQARALSSTSARILQQHQPHSPYAATTGTKHLSFSEDLPLPRTGSFSEGGDPSPGPHASNGAIPSPSPSPSSSSQSSRFTYPMTFTPGGVHGSNLSLVSTSSSHSVYSSSEEKHAAEVRKLKRDLEAAQAKVHTLTSQLSTNSFHSMCADISSDKLCKYE